MKRNAFTTRTDGHGLMRAVLLVLLLTLTALPASADYKDWRIGHSGDYAFFDVTPAPLSTFQGDLTLTGLLGNDKPTPKYGSEDQWVAWDKQGDGAPIFPLIPEQEGSDIGNVWIQEDDGNSFDIYMRLFDEPVWINPDGAQVLYTVNFTHGSTGVVYRVDAKHVNGYYNATIHVQTDPLAGVPAFCELPHEVTGGFTSLQQGGGFFSWRVEYRDLDVASPPAPFDDDVCQPYITYGAPAQAGQVLTWWRGRVYNGAGGSVWSHSVADESDADDPWWVAYPLGPASTPNGPFTGKLYVMGQYYMDVATGFPCAPRCPWTVTINVDKIESVGCRYQFDIVYGTARDTLFLRGANCLEHDGTTRYVDNIPDKEPTPPEYEPPKHSKQSTVPPSNGDIDLDGRTGEGCEGFRGDEDLDTDGDGLADHCDADWDDDGVLNGADNCPLVYNPRQLDTDFDGIGQDCQKDSDLDANKQPAPDGINDLLDNCPLIPNPHQFDMDGDGIGNECDDDIDGDGVPNKDDACPLDPRGSTNRDGDALCDHEDRDMDGDGYSNNEEMLAGTDPLDADSHPGNASTKANTHGAATAVGSMGLAALLFIAILVLLGVGLFFLVRPRQ